ncbi:MAG: hypothetical protein IJE16_07510 [Ruminococcus sp.]|nr:hypothetical protein [Ruminococcus sp.]
MQNDYKKAKVTVYLSQDTLDKIDSIKVLEHTQSSRGEVIEKAIDFYKSHTDLKQDTDYLLPILKTVIENSIAVYFDRVNRNLFKVAVEQSVQSRCLSKVFDINDEVYEKVRRASVEDVKRTKGTISILDAQE